MSCKPGQPCEEGHNRRRALLILVLMGIIFLALSAASFLDSRGQAIPSAISYAGHEAVDGKRVFQAYNCMGCHTIVGNGAYFGPDLTKLYGKVGPAWLEAFLPSAGAWPTSAAVTLQLRNEAVATEAGVDSIDAYLKKYPAAAERIARRSAHASQMPNLPLSHDEVGQLIAFLKYTSAMNTEGWPPKPRVDGLDFPHARPMPASLQTAGSTTQAGSGEATASSEPVADATRGERIARDTGCMACHSSGSQQLVGPGWADLYGSEVELADGSKVQADDAYLEESIVEPDAKVVAGFAPHLMPSYAGMLDDGQIAAVIAYIRSLAGEQP